MYTHPIILSFTVLTAVIAAFLFMCIWTIKKICGAPDDPSEDEEEEGIQLSPSDLRTIGESRVRDLLAKETKKADKPDEKPKGT